MANRADRRLAARSETGPTWNPPRFPPPYRFLATGQCFRKIADIGIPSPSRRRSLETQATTNSFNDDYFVFHSQEHHELFQQEIDTAVRRHEREHPIRTRDESDGRSSEDQPAALTG